MDSHSESSTDSATQDLLKEVLDLRAAIVAAAEETSAGLALGAAPSEAIRNLTHYLALRRHDVRDLQRRLMWHGLSSLGRAEGRVLPAFDAVLTALAALAGQPSPVAPPTEDAFFFGRSPAYPGDRYALWSAPGAPAQSHYGDPPQ